MKRANYLPAPHYFNLNAACQVVNEAFGSCYLVGSSLERRDFRDVDVRCIIGGDDFDRLFGGPGANAHDARWSLVCSSIAAWLSQQSGLPVDFQIQRMTQANEMHDGKRSALGILLSHYPGEVPSVLSKQPHEMTDGEAVGALRKHDSEDPYWARAKEIAAEVATWPEWKRADIHRLIEPAAPRPPKGEP